MALNKEQTFFRVDTACHYGSVSVKNILSHNRRLLSYGYCVQVSKSINAVELILHVYPVSYSAQIVSQSDCTAGLNGAENYLFLFCFHYNFPPKLYVDKNSYVSEPFSDDCGNGVNF